MFEKDKKKTNEVGPDPVKSDFELDSEQLEALTEDEKQSANYLDEPEENTAEMFERLKNTKTKDLNESTAVYLNLSDFKEHEERDFIFTGKTTFTDKDGQAVMAVKLKDIDNNSFICASKIVVDSCMKIEKMPAAIRVRMNGKKKGKNGDYYDAQVFTL